MKTIFAALALLIYVNLYAQKKKESLNLAGTIVFNSEYGNMYGGSISADVGKDVTTTGLSLDVLYGERLVVVPKFDFKFIPKGVSSSRSFFLNVAAGWVLTKGRINYEGGTITGSGNVAFDLMGGYYTKPFYISGGITIINYKVRKVDISDSHGGFKVSAGLRL